ncbi:MAG: GNAT family N-acetyltransferase [archaeon]|nr:GNAT family N-acetyltransferase [archaeon]
MIEEASETDCEELERLIAQEFAYKGLDRQKISMRIQTPGIMVFKKIVGKKIAGFVEIEITEGGIGMINAISVSRKMRNKGYGKELLRHALGRLADNECKTARLLVKKNNSAAKKLYQDHGFWHSAVHTKKIDGEEIEVWEKEITTEHDYLN